MPKTKQQSVKYHWILDNIGAMHEGEKALCAQYAEAKGLSVQTVLALAWRDYVLRHRDSIRDEIQAREAVATLTV